MFWGEKEAQTSVNFYFYCHKDQDNAVIPACSDWLVIYGIFTSYAQ